jgi:hypothetical protein
MAAVVPQGRSLMLPGSWIFLGEGGRSRTRRPLTGLLTHGGVNNINTDEVRGLAIPLPPVAEQREIVRRASELPSRADSLNTRIDGASRHVERTSQATLAKAFRGDVVGA